MPPAPQQPSAPAVPAGLPGTAARVLDLVASGVVSSRADLVRELGLAASTVSARVQELVDQGLLTEVGEGTSRGGRRPRLLRIPDDGAVALAADLGSHHVRLAAVGLTGSAHDVEEHALDLAAGPAATLGVLVERLRALAERQRAAGRTVRGLGVGFPGPVDTGAGRVVAPSRMPGWHLFDLRDRLADALGLPVLVDNDANVMALGEHRTVLPHLRHLVLVKAGRGIGSGVISHGTLYRGAGGAAGDISHVRVEAAAERPCSCGNIGCLETVASGASLVAALRERGLRVDGAADVLRLVRDGEPRATTLVRQAGRHIGTVLSVVVNFFNPQAVVLGGALAEAEPLVAAVRGMLYERCLPMTTSDLVITASATGPDAGLLGAGHAALRELAHEPPAEPGRVAAAQATEPGRACEAPVAEPGRA
ncbi:ROK family transcriptional regulator [Streptomyces diacarni]|uniref:ROK family transcriptional regulator n=1 Tax=Streptomyces diacarni TaxID=2800381 RepID=A0A367EQG3_9ACTN|nr:ROK family transcriptional regulator [Streptomyces diacarni]RCG19825.1 ROK family transcriptional regulator [Streptomyces diacarni]